MEKNQPLERSRACGEGRLLLSATQLRKAFGGQVVLNGVNLFLKEREIVLLQGVNGSAKTTLINILTGNIVPDSGTIRLLAGDTERVFHFPRRTWMSRNSDREFNPERFAAGGIGREWQDIRLFGSQNLLDNLAVAPRHLGESPFAVLFRHAAVMENERRVRTQASTCLAQLGLKGREFSSADKISLGQAKRAAIARAVQAGAKVLFLDEPLAGLDQSGVSQVLEMLKNLVEEQRLTLVIVEHVFNVSSILEFATSVWTLKDGSLRVDSPTAIKTQILELADGPIFEIRKRLASSITSERTVRLDGLELLIFSRNEKNTSQPLLDVKDLVVYRGDRLVVGYYDEAGSVHGISFVLFPGDIALLLAPNGTGKTSLAEALAGVVKISKGKIHLNGARVDTFPIWERVSRGLLFLQARNHTFPDLTVAESLKLARIGDAPLSLKKLLKRRVSNLSLGERQRLAFESALRRKRYILGVLDEPFSALDTENVRTLVEHIQNAQDSAFLICLPNQMPKKSE